MFTAESNVTCYLRWGGCSKKDTIKRIPKGTLDQSVNPGQQQYSKSDHDLLNQGNQKHDDDDNNNTHSGANVVPLGSGDVALWASGCLHRLICLHWVSSFAPRLLVDRVIVIPLGTEPLGQLPCANLADLCFVIEKEGYLKGYSYDYGVDIRYGILCPGVEVGLCLRSVAEW